MVRVVSNKALIDFSAQHAGSGQPLQLWREIIETSTFKTFADLRTTSNTFNTIDKVGDLFVFNIGGNKFCLVAAIHFDRQMLFVRHVLTHAQYDRWRPKS